MLHGGHVSVDVLYGKASPRRRAWIDIGGTLLFLFPWLAVVATASAPFVLSSWGIREGSGTAGGMPALYLLKGTLLVFAVLVAMQALVSKSAYGTPRRAVVGWDTGRLAMVLAVLEARCGFGFGDQDVYLNVAGGLRINEPAADLAAAAALISSATDTPLPQGCVVFGEISLSGEIRAVGRAEARLREAQKLGFDRALTPPLTVRHKGVGVTSVTRLAEAVERISQNRY
jgi:predicted ATP-dependent serine protease